MKDRQSFIVKAEGLINFDNFNIVDDADYYICHLQAPTSINRTWLEALSHPFSSASWDVSHNGVLSNHDTLVDKYNLKNVNSVDSSIIPALLQHFTESSKFIEGHDIISQVLSELEGSFSLCIVDSDSGEVYIARQGSTLFMNPLNGSFSSISGAGYYPVPEGIVFQLDCANVTSMWKEVSTFKSTSPFLFL